MKKIYFFLAKYLGPVLIKILKWTVRIETENAEIVRNLRNENKNFILIFWHGTMLVPLILHMKEGINVLVSTHFDGDIITALLEKTGCKIMRGSSTRGGREAIEEMIRIIKKGEDVAITTDGPKGPYHKLKMGAVVLAIRTRVPMVHLAVSQKNKKTLKSWDRFMVIKPFSKVAAVYSAPIYPRKFKGKIEEKIDKIEEYIHQVDEKAEKFFDSK